jgi:predicted ATP-dependent protease
MLGKSAQVNGLTVLQVGGSSFGAPSRITVTVYPGSRGIVDIEREAELGLAIHSKGVMILTGYLGNCYAQEFPLAISASIALEPRPLQSLKNPSIFSLTPPIA